jgi:hypothetical protein
METVTTVPMRKTEKRGEEFGELWTEVSLSSLGEKVSGLKQGRIPWKKS